jgi:hypothetical protein
LRHLISLSGYNLIVSSTRLVMISLYVKTHNKTGLKYFGKTKSKNVHQYTGSGVYWRRHLNVHGKDYSTEIIAQFSEDQFEKLNEFAVNFSVENNIVASEEWANFTIETGLDGNSLAKERHPMWGRRGKDHQRYGKPLSEESRKRMSAAQKGRIITDEMKRKISQTLKGSVLSPEVRKKIGESVKGKNKGELSSCFGRHWYTNGKDNVFSFECPEEYRRGRTLPKKSQ